jgi:hypothetical protein
MGPKSSAGARRLSGAQFYFKDGKQFSLIPNITLVVNDDADAACE